MNIFEIINFNYTFFREAGSSHSQFYAAQNMMYMRAAYDPSGFQRTSPYGMGEYLRDLSYFDLFT